MNTLYARLSVAMIAIMVLIGTGFLLFYQRMTQVYFEELTQRLNAPIAMYVTGEESLIGADGTVNTTAMKLLAHRAMVINPTVEVYLVDPDGRILSHALADDAVVRDRIDIDAVRALINGDAKLPLHGDDPRSASSRKIFSAAEINVGGNLAGYLYVVLGGKAYDDLVASLNTTYSARVGVWAVLALSSLGTAAGLVVFFLLTRRLSRLRRDVQVLSEGNFEVDIGAPENNGRDEIARLDQAVHRMAARICDQVNRLLESDRLRRELVSNVSHDLRTPIASIQGYLETLLIKNGQLHDTERKRYLEIAKNSTRRLSMLVDDLFELSKLDTGSAAPNIESFSIAELLQDTALELEVEAAAKRVTIGVEAPVGETYVYADIGLIQRVLENLIRNAIQYTPAEGSIRIGVRQRPDSVSIAVSDTGCGIAEWEIDRIFDRFYRHETGDTDHRQASGLGLAIVKRILDLHNSRITVVSQPNAGTCFEFDLSTRSRVA